jgi:hypothetical protein
MEHPDAPSGRETKYARVERERRFLMAAPPSGTPTRRVLIEDRYLRGTRLRLRRMTELDPRRGPAIYKLTQKIPRADGGPGLITNLYLSAAEYAAFVGIPADEIRKIRSSFPPLGVDVSEGPLSGLVLAEAEFDTPTEEAAFETPPDAIAEVTTDVRFTGGSLAKMSAEETVALLIAIGIAR